MIKGMVRINVLIGVGADGFFSEMDEHIRTDEYDKSLE